MSDSQKRWHCSMLEWSCLMIELYHHSWNLIWHMCGLSQSETRQERPGQSMEECQMRRSYQNWSLLSRAQRNPTEINASAIQARGHMDTVLEGLFRGVPKWWKECNVCYTFHFGPFISAINKTICDNNRIAFSYTVGRFCALL